LGNSNQPIVRDPSWVKEGDVLWLESTYANRLHKSKEETIQELLRIIQEAVAHQAKVVIPAFAVERTQDIIYTLGQFIRKGLIPSIPVYIDSPLAISATEIFKRNPDCFDQETRALLLGGEDPLDLPQLIYARTTEQSKAINEDTRPGIIVSASGMCDAGRIQHHLKHHLWQAESHIVFIGYQAEGTIGRRIIDGAKTVRLFGEEIAVKAHVHTLGGFSAHADQKGLIEWLSHLDNPELEIFVNHGDEKVSLELSELIRQQFHLKTIVPQWREKRVLFGPEEVSQMVMPGIEPVPRIEPVGEEREKITPPMETLSVLFRHLDRSYKKLRRKLKRGRAREMEVQDPRWLKQLEEINERLEKLESELGPTHE
jgi:metallo-beta-lactamase family protein